ncbi:hypothetical protein Catovirus_1_463 [Catovirus CTV1]|uniref:Uncharacterized protein n=1 Tax=Catovirus CTV1 TaxID=1977631 RepID=A0A1V0S9N7_9VIRU|nr:hypothetical protein Catovirus_1_463 [Catovirus CTV1]
MQDIRYNAKKLRNFIDDNKNILVSIFDDDFYYLLKKITKKYKFKYTNKIIDVLHLINEKLVCKQLKSKIKYVLTDLKQLLKNLFKSINIEHSYAD